MTDLVKTERFTLTPSSFTEAIKFAETLATSDIVPKDFKGNAGNILVAIQWGLELGLQPMQAMQNIAVINGRPSLWGDAVIGLVRSSPLCEYIYESIEGDTAICRVKRKGEEEQQRTFSMAEAKQAGLAGKNVWAAYPKRMLQMRARAFALRDVFPDVLKGLPIAEEVQDYQEKDITPKAEKPLSIENQPAPELPIYPQEKLLENLPLWCDAIEAGKTSPEQIVKTISSKYTLTEEQKQIIENGVLPE